MDQNKKIDALRVTKKIGDMLGGMDTSELANYIAGAALTGDVNKEEVIAIGIAKLAAKSPEILANLPEGSIKDTVLGMIGGNPQEVVAGFGGNLLGGSSNDNPDNPGLTMSAEEYQKIADKANQLSQDYYDGKITEEQFKTEYGKLEDIMSKHPIAKKTIGNILSADKVIKQNNINHLNELNTSFEELNNKAKSGAISTSDYDEQYDNIIANAQKWGASAKLIDSLKKNRLNSKQILKAVEKANKKKK